MKNISENYASPLYQAVMQLKNEDECRRFFEDLCTISELRSMSQRVEVAKMLRKKTIYNAIAEATGASTATISRVNKCLNYGMNGYNLVLERLDENGEL